VWILQGKCWNGWGMWLQRITKRWSGENWSEPESMSKVGKQRVRWPEDEENDLPDPQSKRWRYKAKDRAEWASVVMTDLWCWEDCYILKYVSNNYSVSHQP
jgi:hypothetical protein